MNKDIPTEMIKMSEEKIMIKTKCDCYYYNLNKQVEAFFLGALTSILLLNSFQSLDIINVNKQTRNSKDGNSRGD